MKRKVKRKNRILIAIATILIAMATILIINAPLHKQTIPTRFIAGEKMGFDLGPGNLNFGQIIPGYSASREITITNTFDSPTITKIKSSGAISEYIIVSQNNFILQPNESRNITFSLFPPEGIELKEYPGQITITTYKD
jgi:Abnormal spindle-like microcephaly-assoc'd, ASPM-SPD-2-Hydin